MPSPFYPASVVLFQLHGGMVSYMQALATPSSTVHNTKYLDPYYCSFGCLFLIPCISLFLENVFGLYFCHFFNNKVIPMQLPNKGVWPVKASDLLLGDYVCEKSDTVKWIDCP